MEDGLKFFFSITVAVVVTAIALSGAVKMQKTQNKTIEKAGQKVEKLLN